MLVLCVIMAEIPGSRGAVSIKQCGPGDAGPGGSPLDVRNSQLHTMCPPSISSSPSHLVLFHTHTD